MVVRGLDKLAVDFGLQPTHLYHLQDPYEIRNLATIPDARHKREEMLVLVRRWLSRTSDRIQYAIPRNAAVGGRAGAAKYETIFPNGVGLNRTGMGGSITPAA